MPFRSEAQRRYLWANHPEMARRWAHETPKGTKLPAKVGKCTGSGRSGDPTPVVRAPRLMGKISGPSFVVVRGAMGPGNHTPELPDFQSLYAQPEAQERQRKEAEQSANRRRSTWRDLDSGSLYGPIDDKPIARYGMGKTSTADIALTQPRHYLTAKELRASKDRIARGLGYSELQTGKPKRSKVR